MELFNSLFGHASPHPTKLHHQFAALIDMYLHANIKFMPPIVFEILKFKNPTNLIG